MAAIVFFLMTTWLQGRTALLRKLERDTYTTVRFHRSGSRQDPCTEAPPIYMTSRVNVVPVPLLHLKHNKVLHERIVLMHVVTEMSPA